MKCSLAFFLFLLQLLVPMGKSKVICIDVGNCEKCEKNEKGEDYCQDTGKRVKQSCSNEAEESFFDFRSCRNTPEDEQFQVIVFQVAMAVVGGLAFWGVQNRKVAHMTLFDYRKQNANRTLRV